jgi:hypothetical protein
MISAREILMSQELAEEGENTSSISALMHGDRKVIEEASMDKKERESKSILDAHKPFILAQLEKADFTAQRLVRDIEGPGCTRGYDVVKKFGAP